MTTSAYLAVDMFFMMSGFVIVRAYERKLTDGAFFTTFVIKGYGRFAPMWLIGIACGFAASLPGIWHLRSFGSSAATLALSALLLPGPFSPFLFPFSGQGWSLLAELIVNLLYAGGIFRLSTGRLLALSMALLVAFAGDIAIRGDGLSFGLRWDQLDITLLRAGFAFLLGACLCRWQGRSSREPARGLAVASLVAVVIFLLAPTPAGIAAQLVYHLFAVLVVFPAIVWTLSATSWSTMAFRKLGALSYPLYAIHVGIFMLAGTMEGLLTHWHRTLVSPIAAVAICAGTLIVALVLGERIDPWCQRRFARFAGVARSHVPYDPATPASAAKF